MRLPIFNVFISLKLLSCLKQLIKCGLQAMVISDKWTCYREDDVEKPRYVEGLIWMIFGGIKLITSFPSPNLYTT